MQQAKKYLKLIERVALGILIASLSLGIYFAFYPKVKDREKYKQIYLLFTISYHFFRVYL